MAEGGVHDFGAFAVSLEQVGSDLGMAAFHVVIGGFADIVQQAARRASVGSMPSSSAIIPETKATSIECRRTFWL